MTETKQKLPKWFKGQIYAEGSIVENPFSKEEYELNALELSIYDFIMGSQVYLSPTRNSPQEKYGLSFDVSVSKTVTTKQVNDFHKALTWFRKNNSEAYMVLLD